LQKRRLQQLARALWRPPARGGESNSNQVAFANRWTMSAPVRRSRRPSLQREACRLTRGRLEVGRLNKSRRERSSPEPFFFRARLDVALGPVLPPLSIVEV
jgi:hypothetical protein